MVWIFVVLFPPLVMKLQLLYYSKWIFFVCSMKSHLLYWKWHLVPRDASNAHDAFCATKRGMWHLASPSIKQDPDTLKWGGLASRICASETRAEALVLCYIMSDTYWRSVTCTKHTNICPVGWFHDITP